MPTVPVRLEAWKAWVRGLKSVPLAGPGFLFKAGDRTILILRTVNGTIIFIFWRVQVTYIIVYEVLKSILFFWPS